MNKELATTSVVTAAEFRAGLPVAYNIAQRGDVVSIEHRDRPQMVMMTEETLNRIIEKSKAEA